MTHPDFDTFPAGPELDWLVLHHALDWKLGYPALGQQAYRFAGEEYPALWPVSTEWEAAERVLGMLDLRAEVGTGRVRLENRHGVVEAEGETPALAFSRAVMKAMVAVMLRKG